MLLLLTSICNSQTEVKFGVRGEAAHNLASNSGDKLTTYRVIAALDLNKLQIYSGLVFSKKSKVNYSFGSDVKSYKGLTGGIIGGRFYLKKAKNKGVYNFFECTILNYSTYECIKRSFYPPYDFELVDDNSGKNKTFFIQPTVGAGLEYKFYKIIALSLDAGLGYSYRSLAYEDNYAYVNYNDTFGDELSGICFQVKIGLGIIF